MDMITQHVIAPVEGGIMISHGSLFVMILWIMWAKIKSVIKSRKSG